MSYKRLYISDANFSEGATVEGIVRGVPSEAYMVLRKKTLQKICLPFLKMGVIINCIIFSIYYESFSVSVYSVYAFSKKPEPP